MFLSELISSFVRWLKVHRRPRTAEFYEHQLAGLLRLVGDCPADQMKRSSIMYHKLTWHRLYALQRLFNWAVDDVELLTCNPFARMRRPKIKQRKYVLRGYGLVMVPRRSYRAYRQLLILHRESAARPQEGRVLQWEWIQTLDPDQDRWQQILRGRAWFDVPEYKSQDRRADPDEPRCIPISPRLGRLLERIARKRPQVGIIFRNRKGEPWTPDALHGQMFRLKSRLRKDPNVDVSKLCLYTFRHSSATEMARRGVHPKVLAMVLGHTNVATTNRYLHLAEQDMMQAMQGAWRPSKQRPA